MHNHTQLRRTIMRRVWYTFLVSVFVRPATVQGFLFGASIIAFWKLVSVTSIANNFLSVRVGELPGYAWSAFSHAETITILVFGIIVFTVLSVGIQIPRFALQYRDTHQTQSA